MSRKLHNTLWFSVSSRSHFKRNGKAQHQCEYSFHTNLSAGSQPSLPVLTQNGGKNPGSQQSGRIVKETKGALATKNKTLVEPAAGSDQGLQGVQRILRENLQMNRTELCCTLNLPVAFERLRQDDRYTCEATMSYTARSCPQR